MAGASAKQVDFSGVKDRGNFNKKRVPEGDYLAVIAKVEDAETKEDKKFQYLFTIKLKKYSQAAYPYYCQLQENQLWKLRNIFIAAGKTVPKRKTKVNPNEIVGKMIGVTMEDSEWNDREQSEIAAVFPAADLGDSSNEDDVPDDDDEAEEAEEEVDEDEAEEDEAEEDADEPEEDPYADLDRAGIKAAILEFQPDFKAKKSQTDDDLREILRELAAVPSDADDEDEAEEDEAEEEEPPPPPAKKSKKRKSSEVTDDELEELNIDDI